MPFADVPMALSRALVCFLGRQLTHNSRWTDGWMIDDGDRVDVPVLKHQTRKLEIVIDSLLVICIAHRYLLGPALLQSHVGRSRHWQCMTSHDIGRPAHWPARRGCTADRRAVPVGRRNSGVHCSPRLAFLSRKSRVGGFLTPEVACITWSQSYLGPCMHQLSEAKAVSGNGRTNKSLSINSVQDGFTVKRVGIHGDMTF